MRTTAPSNASSCTIDRPHSAARAPPRPGRLSAGPGRYQKSFIMHTRTVIGLFLGVLALAWGLDVVVLQAPLQGDWPWLLRQQSLYLTGIWSIGLMSLVMILALRPAWLERPLGGMDRVYRLHK